MLDFRQHRWASALKHPLKHRLRVLSALIVGVYEHGSNLPCLDEDRLVIFVPRRKQHLSAMFVVYNWFGVKDWIREAGLEGRQRNLEFARNGRLGFPCELRARLVPPTVRRGWARADSRLARKEW
jgi:hypothetical protein